MEICHELWSDTDNNEENDQEDYCLKKQKTCISTELVVEKESLGNISANEDNEEDEALLPKY